MLPASKRRKLENDEDETASESSIAAELSNFVASRPLQFKAHNINNESANQSHRRDLEANWLRPSQQSSLAELIHQLSNSQASAWDETIHAIRGLDSSQLLHLRAPTFAKWMQQQGRSWIPLAVASKLAAEGLISLTHFIEHQFGINETRLVAELRELSLKSPNSSFSFVLFCLLNRDNSSKDGSAINSRTLSRILANLCPKHLSDENDVAVFCAVLESAAEMNPLKVAEDAAYQFLLSFLTSDDTLSAEQQLAIDILVKFMNEPSSITLIDRLLNMWTQKVEAKSLASLTMERFCSYRDLDLICAVPLWRRFIAVEAKSSAEISLALEKMILSIQPDSDALKVCLMLAAVLLSDVPAEPGASFTKYEDWLRNLLQDANGHNLRPLVSLALQQLLNRQSANVINSNIKVFVSSTFKAKPESREYVQLAKEIRGDVTKLPSEAAREPKESVDQLLKAWEEAFNSTGRLPIDVRQKKFLHPNFFATRIVPTLLESAAAENSPRSKTFVKAFFDEKLISTTQYEAFIASCEPPSVPAPPQMDISAPNGAPVANPMRTDGYDINSLCGQISSYMAASVTHASSVDPIASALQQCVSNETRPDEAERIAESIIQIFLSPSSAASKLDASFAASNEHGVGSPRQMQQSASSIRLSIRQLRLFVLGVWPNSTLYSAFVAVLDRHLKSAFASDPADAVDLRPYASVFICLAGKVAQRSDDLDWCQSIMNMCNSTSLPRLLDFVILLVRLAETGFGLVTSRPGVLDHHRFTANPTIPKTNLYDDTVAYIPLNAVYLLSVVHQRLKFESDTVLPAIWEDRLGTIRKVFDSSFFRALKIDAGEPPLPAFLKIILAMNLQGSYDAIFLRQGMEAYISNRGYAEVASDLADSLLTLTGATNELVIVQLILECVHLRPSPPIPGSIWLLDWIESRLVSQPAAKIFSVAAKFPTWTCFHALGGPSHHTVDALARIDKFLQSTFRDNARVVLECVPVRNWLHGFLSLVPKTKNPDELKLCKGFLFKANLLSVLFTIHWGDLGEDAIVGPQGELRSLFDFQRAIYGACASFLTSRSPTLDYSLILDPLQKYLSATIFVAHTLVSLVSLVALRQENQVARAGDVAVVASTDALPIRVESSLLSSRILNLLVNMWNISISGGSKVPSENLKSLVAIIVQTAACVASGDYQVPASSSDRLFWTKTLWSVLIACPEILDVSSSLTSGLIKTNRNFILGFDQAALNLRIFRCLCSLDAYTMNVQSYKIQEMPPEHRGKVGAAILRLMSSVRTESKPDHVGCRNCLIPMLKNCFSATSPDRSLLKDELIRLFPELQDLV